MTENVYCLDGNWKFCLKETVQEGLAVVTDDNNNNITWKTIPVPSNWTLQPEACDDRPIYTNQKYPWPCQPPLVPYRNPTGVYQVEFDLSSTSWNNTAVDDYALLFHGVESAFYVYLNGEFVGFSKDSRLPAEFDVTSCLSLKSKTKNVLQVVVLRWSDGSYVEDQDHWWMAGMHCVVLCMYVYCVHVRVRHTQ